MGATKGNRFWLERLDLTYDGRKLSVKEVEEKSIQYIKTYIENPITEKDFRGKDNSEVALEKPRAMILESLCTWLGISVATWKEWRKDKKYIAICTRVEQFMYSYNLEYASANQMNASIIAKKLGLVDKKEQTIKGIELGQAYSEKYED